ncbi:serine hydrolase domain-containing protein [Moritella dasanensis]|uniref:serine hydrolase domain-containing protein n=1 Tax=Moritella dasanensis TaxID=428031 RepID=UPI0002E89978|nr:serine hydrolase [Moritella dasanensis]
MPESNPERLGWMQGFPPSKDKVIRFNDGTFYQWPQLRWTFSNIQQLVPTKFVWRGDKAATALPKHDLNFEQLTITIENGEQLTWEQALESGQTDGLAILHKGVLVHESYHAGCKPHLPHTVMSCGKSIAGIIAEILMTKGVLNENALMSSYMPEYKGTAWEDATLRQTLDMLIGLKFNEDYFDRNSDVWLFLRAGGMVPTSPDDIGPKSLVDYLVTVKKQGEHGQAFAYREPNINAITWLLQRITNTDLAELVSTHIWQHIGAEHDAYYMLDGIGFCTTPSCTLRDFARLGEFVRTGGEGQQLSSDYIHKLAQGGDPALFAKATHSSMKGWSYNGLWWIRHTEKGNKVMARGAHGQFLYIDPTAEVVIARFASTEQAPSYLKDNINMPLFDTITKHIEDTIGAS